MVLKKQTYLIKKEHKYPEELNVKGLRCHSQQLCVYHHILNYFWLYVSCAAAAPPAQLIAPTWLLSVTHQTPPAPVIMYDIIRPDRGRPIGGSRGRWADVVHVCGTPSLWQTCAPIRKAINFNFSCDLASHLRLLLHNGWLCSFCGWPGLSNSSLAIYKDFFFKVRVCVLK